MSTRHSLYVSTLLPIVLLSVTIHARATDTPRITTAIDESALVQLTGNTPPARYAAVR
jgi:hypothetical protein